MLGIFQDTEAALYPAHDPTVIACQAALDAARREAEPAQQAWRDYVIEHCDEAVSIPFSRQRQRLFDDRQDTSEAVRAAETAYAVALDAATAKATAAWDSIIRQQFLDDLPPIEAFLVLLEKYEARLVEAQAAGVRPLNVPVVFITASEVAERLQYAKRALGLEE